MGARENQGLQIALIIFVTITVILAVTTYTYWKQSDELAAEKATDRAEKDKAQEETRRLTAELREVKEVLGHLPTATSSEIKVQSEKDMALFAKSYQGPRSYLTLPAFLLDEITKRNQLVVDLERMNDKLAADLRDRGVQGAAQLAVSQKDRENLSRELEAKQATFTIDRNRITADSTKIASKLEEEVRRAAALRDQYKKEVNLLHTTIAQLRQLVRGLMQAKRQLQPKGEAETADGKITFVDQRTRTAGIDLGSADGLRRQMTFSVVDRDAARVGSARRKGSIEIVSIDGEHSAIARITDDDLRDPILAGDQIFTAAWQPGNKVPFALAGLLDLDGDGHSDRGGIRSLIERHGGVIDAEVDELGSTSGSLRFETRYLVVGAQPNERTNAAGLKGYMALMTEADRMGVEKLQFDKFLQMVGYRPQGKTTTVGSPARRRDASP